MNLVILRLACVFLSLLVSEISYGQKCSFSDEFEGEILDSSWQHFQSEYYSVQLSNGQLTMDIEESYCNNNCPWFHSQSAGFIYKTIIGDFELQSIVHSVEASGANAGDDINNDTQLGGLMARDGSSGTENYVFNVVGTRFDIPSVETKSTTNNNSGTIEHFGISNTVAELRMTRNGTIFQMYSKDIGASTWIHRSTFNRPDLPDTLQVGIIAYAFQSYPEDLAVKFDYAKFADFTKVNYWIGGNGMWNDNAMWSLNEVPDSSHRVIVDNTQSQIIQILEGEIFDCYSLDIQSNETQLNIEGQLNVLVDTSACD